MASQRPRTSNGQNAHSRRNNGLTLDTGALIALDHGDKRMIALLQQALAQGCVFRVPSGVVGQAWRDGRSQATLARFLRSEEVEIIPLDEQLARACGELCGATSTSDMIDASVAILATARRGPMVTSDPHDLHPCLDTTFSAGRS